LYGKATRTLYTQTTFLLRHGAASRFATVADGRKLKVMCFFVENFKFMYLSQSPARVEAAHDLSPKLLAPAWLWLQKMVPNHPFRNLGNALGVAGYTGGLGKRRPTALVGGER
jgi:hypothetical protein